jgi:hypothetical protein
MSRNQFPVRSLDVFNWPNPHSYATALRSTQPTAEMNTRSITGGQIRPTRKDDLSASVSRLSRETGEPRCLTILWVTATCYWDVFNFSVYSSAHKRLIRLLLRHDKPLQAYNSSIFIYFSSQYYHFKDLTGTFTKKRKT